MNCCAQMFVAVLAAGLSAHGLRAAQTYTIVDSGQAKCYDDHHEIAPPQPGQPFSGQDAQYRGVQPSYRDNGDGTVTDLNTGLTWQKADSGKGLTWEQALAYAESLKLAAHTDWRLPNAKELQSILDYTRIPAIAPIFQISQLPDGEHPFFWSSTTHLDGPPDRPEGSAAVCVCFGRALGWMSFPPGVGEPRLLDVHGAGAQRSDPKAGDPAAFPHGRGPQGDVIRIYNYVRCVRGGEVERQSQIASAPPRATTREMNREAGSPPMAPVGKRPPTPPPEGGPGGGPGMGGPRLPASPVITALDLNGDGIIDADEIAKAPASLKRLDRNGDGKLTPDEYRPQRPGGPGGPGGPGMRGEGFRPGGPGGPPPGAPPAGQGQRPARQRPPSE